MDFAGEKRVLDSELWHACAGPLVSLPALGSRVVYFPQGHSEQVIIYGVRLLLHEKNPRQSDPSLSSFFLPVYV